MRTSLNPLMYTNWEFERKYTTPGTYTLAISPGRYRIVARGGGGAGGTPGDLRRLAATQYGGDGGAGGMGTLTQQEITVSSNTKLTIYVADGGKTYANGGNGGTAGTSATDTSAGGTGGGGGMTSYVKGQSANTTFVFAQGGGGGGGGGGPGPQGRYYYGGGGGGGGGYYEFYPFYATQVSVPGKTGGIGGNKDHPAGNGVDGNTTTFPTIYSGAGGKGDEGYGPGAGASGGGASGGGGGGGGNHDSAHANGGGGGAGGTLDAGGGTGGYGEYGRRGGDAYNPKTIPTTVSTENQNVGMPGEYGRGGMGGAINHDTGAITAPTNGNAGFVYIKRIGWV